MSFLEFGAVLIRQINILSMTEKSFLPPTETSASCYFAKLENYFFLQCSKYSSLNVFVHMRFLSVLKIQISKFFKLLKNVLTMSV